MQLICVFVVCIGGWEQQHPQHERTLQNAEETGGGAHLQSDPYPPAVCPYTNPALHWRSQPQTRRLSRALGLPRRLRWHCQSYLFHHTPVFEHKMHHIHSHFKRLIIHNIIICFISWRWRSWHPCRSQKRSRSRARMENSTPWCANPKMTWGKTAGWWSSTVSLIR